jgi:hypothetical protein
VTSTEQTGRKPVAKEIAQQALALATEANSTAQTVLAELRDLRESGAPAMVVNGSPDPKVVERLDKLDEDIEGLLENLNTVAQAANASPIGPDDKMIDPAAVVAEMRAAFTAHAQKIDENNEAAKKAIAELRQGAAGTAVGMLTKLTGEVEDLKSRLQTWDEAGVAPASAEDVGDLDTRLRAVEALTRADAVIARGDAPTGVPAVFAQVHQLMLLVTQLGKDSEADEKMGGYKFRSIDAAMDAVGHAMRQVGLMFVPGAILDHKVKQYEITKHFNNGGSSVQNWTHVWVRQEYKFVSLVDGSELTGIEMDGEARDNGDKSTSKADSMRFKYALLQTLCIPIKGLPESDGRDGTENADWGTAPPIGNGNGGQQQAYPDEPTWEPGDAQHSRPDAPAGEPAAEKPDDRPDDVKAAAAHAALRKLNELPPDQRRPRFLKIADGIRKAGIGHVQHEGVTMNAHLSAANANLGAG